MFLHRRARRAVLHVPVVWFACGGLFTALGSLVLERGTTDVGGSLAVGALALGSFVYACLTVRHTQAQDDTLRVRSLTSARTMPRAEVALGYRVRGSSRNVRTQLYATDGNEVVVLGEGVFGAARARRHVARMSQTLQLGAGSPRALAHCQRDASSIARSEAFVADYYESAAWRRSGRLLLGGLVLYLLAMGAFLWFTSH